MLWKLLLAMVSMIMSLFRAPYIPDIPYEITPYGPQNWEEALRASHALQDEEDDIRYDEDLSYGGTKDERFRWPGYPGRGIIPYVMDRSLKSKEKLIHEAMEQYHNTTCIRFVPRTNQRNYIRIINSENRCYSYVGYQRRDAQLLSLGKDCLYIGTIVHELGHAIGMPHEHQQSDRDNYINVYMKNVEPDEGQYFRKADPSQEIKWDKYDYDSIMHYGWFAFSKQPGKLKTMEAKDGHPLKEPYDKPGLHQNDIDYVRSLYKCQ